MYTTTTIYRVYNEMSRLVIIKMVQFLQYTLFHKDIIYNDVRVFIIFHDNENNDVHIVAT